MRIGVVGLGVMGAPVAATLAGAHEVLAYDIDRGRAEAAAASGIPVARSMKEVVRASEVMITVLPGPGETATVMDAVEHRFTAGSIWLDLSTGDPRVTRRVVERMHEAGVACVTATMAGGPAAARARELLFTVAGAVETVQRITPPLELLAAPGGVDVIGTDPAEAQTVKLLSNLLWFGQVVAVTEAMLLGRATGIEPARLQELLAARAGSSVMLERDYGAVLRGDYMGAFGIDRVVEQIATMRAMAADFAVPFELSSVVARVHEEALAAYGPVAGELLAAKLLEERSGRPLAR
ncbi:NAD(P)-dependent oxidoreductase [Microbacterium jejuense]|uniref:NAD(P)-dependent oxidoreductase n=1 Tax=Microbacterium jejuense TaxID=1263637 RepID=A0ABS7HNH4_9MICO|nr:NAD(P)-binding domain-containing protein [Microbacterium jejuense]MBW9094507.1 NAD(P)-dependent oxidoreductase [Microbacterium jejuense]